MAQRIARMDKCINHECADRIIVIKEASRLRSLGCTGNSDSTGDGGHGGSNEVMDASTGNSDNTTDGQHGGSNGVMDAPLLRSLGCTGNSGSTDRLICCLRQDCMYSSHVPFWGLSAPNMVQWWSKH